MRFSGPSTVPSFMLIFVGFIVFVSFPIQRRNESYPISSSIIVFYQLKCDVLPLEEFVALIGSRPGNISCTIGQGDLEEQ